MTIELKCICGQQMAQTAAGSLPTWTCPSCGYTAVEYEVGSGAYGWHAPTHKDMSPALPIPDDTAASPMLGGDRAIVMCKIHNIAMFRDLFGQYLCPECVKTIYRRGLYPLVTRERLPNDPAWFTAGKTVSATQITNVRVGLHPMGMRLSEDTATRCGTCKHLTESRYAKVYLKCDLIKNTFGASTDIRKGWQGCEHWEAIEGE